MAYSNYSCSQVGVVLWLLIASELKSCLHLDFRTDLSKYSSRETVNVYSAMTSYPHQGPSFSFLVWPHNLLLCFRASLHIWIDFQPIAKFVYEELSDRSLGWLWTGKRIMTNYHVQLFYYSSTYWIFISWATYHQVFG